MDGKKLWMIPVALSDLLMFNLAFRLAYVISVTIYGPKILHIDEYLMLLVFGNFTLLTVFFTQGLYQVKRGLFDSEEFYVLLKSVVLCYILISAATFLSHGMDYSRLIITNTFISSLFLITVTRSFLNYFFIRSRIRGFRGVKTVILGRTAIGKTILKKIGEHPELGYDFAGFVDLSPDLPKVLKKRGVQTVFVVENVDHEALIDLVADCDSIEFKIVPDLVNLISEPLSFDEFRDIPLISISRGGESSIYSRRIKRMFDFASSALMLLILSPLFLLVAVAIKIDSIGPVFFRQKRVGLNERLITVFKFRTMNEDAESLKSSLSELNEVKGLFKLTEDPRVTRVGYILRRTCIDELPQLMNILRGDMSLVGPRPHIPEELEFFLGWRRNRFKVKPGLTGIWQVSGRHEMEFDKAVLMDLYYIKHLSFMLDLKILIKTIPSIVYSKGRW
ncbi:MAG: sugar transferase [Methanobacteriota archaeon]